jgi:DNA-binding transcriptional LysR family regulator
MDLECFVTLAEELHFGRAAHRLGLGTPALSKRVSELERSLGARLFVRTTRSVRLTSAGETLLPAARRCLADADELRTLAADVASGRAGTVRLGYVPGAGELVAMLARELARRSPNLVLHPIQMLSVKITAAVEAGELLAGVVRVPPGPQLATMELAENPLSVLVMPADHPLAQRDELCLDDLDDQTVIGAARSLTGDIYGPRRWRFREADVTTEAELVDLVASGLGLLVTTPGCMRRNPRDDVVVRPLGGWDRSSKEILIWRRGDAPPVLRALLDATEAIRPLLAATGDRTRADWPGAPAHRLTG